MVVMGRQPRRSSQSLGRPDRQATSKAAGPKKVKAASDKGALLLVHNLFRTAQSPLSRRFCECNYESTGSCDCCAIQPRLRARSYLGTKCDPTLSERSMVGTTHG
jgi:hypothetical protein